MMNGKRSNYKGKRNNGYKKKDGKAFRSGVDTGESISKWDEPDKRFPNTQLDKANDPRWYAFNEQLLNDSASFAFSWPVGGQLNTGLTALDAKSIPGIMVFKTVPAFGQSLDGTSALNTAARNIYSFVRHANAGHTNYESTDLMMYIMAMDSVHSFVSFMKRAYGVINLYSYENRYYPDALLRAMGLDPADFRKHIADFRAFINMYIVRIGSMCVPASMSYNARHMWMYDNIYVDSDTAKAQTYFYSPEAFYMHTLNSTTGMGYLKYTPLLTSTDDLLTFNELSGYGLALINPILTSEDYNIMSGDILKAFTDAGVIKLSGIPETYQVLPVYNEEVMSQFENLTMMTPFDATVVNTNYTYDLVQRISESAGEGSEGYLFYNPPFMGYKALLGGNSPVGNAASQIMQAMTSDRIINSHGNRVTPADVMVMTRLTNVMDLDVTVGGNLKPTCFSQTIGSDLCLYAKIYRYSEYGQGNVWQLMASPMLYTMLPFYLQGTRMTNVGNANHFNTNVIAGTVGENIVDPAHMNPNSIGSVNTAHFSSNVAAIRSMSDLVCQLSMFDWHPAFYPVVYLQTDNYEVEVGVNGSVSMTLVSDSGQVNGGNVYVGDLLMDVDKYAVIGINGLRKMSEVALLSEFSVPQMGAFARKLG